MDGKASNKAALQGCFIVSLLLVVGIGTCVLGVTSGDSPKPEVNQVECRQSLQCWGDKHSAAASIRCSGAITDQSTFDHEWTDGFLGGKFDRFSWSRQELGSIRYFGSELKVQNRYGAWRRVDYSVIYHPSAETCSDAAIEALID